MQISKAGASRWQTETLGPPRAMLLARDGDVEGAQTMPWPGGARFKHLG